MNRFSTLLIAVVTAMVLGLVSAQAALPEAAAEALDAGEARMAEALATYGAQYPDRPLWQQAFAEGRRAMTLAPEALEPVRFLAVAYSRSNWYGPAWNTWRDYVRRGGDVSGDAEAQTLIADVGQELGYGAYARGDLDLALEYYQSIVALVPRDVNAHVWSGRILIETERPEQSIASWQRVLELDPADTRASYFLELAREQSLYGTAAVNAFRDGVALYEQERLGEASEAFARATTRNPEYAQAWAWLGRVAFERGQFRDAGTYYGRAAALEPTNDTYAWFRAEAARRAGD
jgi:tetratricopeptide (TPR) repeat protein